MSAASSERYRDSPSSFSESREGSETKLERDKRERAQEGSREAIASTRSTFGNLVVVVVAVVV